MKDLHELIRKYLIKIHESYDSILSLNDEPGDLEHIKNEIKKINDLLSICIEKIDSTKNYSDDFVRLLKISKYYLKTYDFSREINIMASLYSTDSKRLKNIRLTVLDSLNDKKLIEKIEDIIENLKSD